MAGGNPHRDDDDHRDGVDCRRAVSQESRGIVRGFAGWSIMMREHILLTINDLVTDFLYYDRKEDEELQRGMIEEAIKKGEITEDEIVQRFREKLHEGLAR